MPLREVTPLDEDPYQLAIKDEGLKPHEIDYVNAHRQLESSGGKNTATSSQDAHGMMQIQPDTFKRVADKGWDINNPYHNARAGIREAMRQLRAAGGNAIAGGAGYLGGDGGRIKAMNGVAAHDANGTSTIDYGNKIAEQMPDPTKMRALTPEEEAATGSVVSAIPQTLKGIKDQTQQKIADLEQQLKGYDVNNPNMFSSQALGHASYDEYKKTKASISAKIAELRGTTQRAKDVEAMHNIVPHDIPLLGLAIPAFAKTELAKQIRDYSEGVPYLDVLASGFASDNPSKLDIAAGETMHKFGAGMADLVDQIRTAIGSPKTVNQAVESMSNRAQDEASTDDVMKEFNANPGWGGDIGGMLPYLISGKYIGAPLTRALGRGVSAIADVPGEVATTSKGLITRAVESKASDPTSLLNPIAKMAKAEITDPWALKAVHNSLQNPPWQSYIKGHAGGLLGPAALGAIEGGLHYDNTMGGGALSSVLGQKIGDKISPLLTRGTDYRAQIPGEAELRDFAYKEGVNATPGADLGNQFYQRFEAGLRNNGTYADRLKKWDVANIKTRNQSAFEGIGIPRKSIDALTPDELLKHETNLKNQYTDWVNKAEGSFDYTDRNAIRNHLTNVAKNTTEEGAKAFKTATYYADQLNKFAGVQRDALGQIKQSKINGEDFQTLRSDLKGEITDSWDKGDRVKAKALQPLLDVLDSSVEKGIRKLGGDPEANINAFKELNRKWAVTEAIKKYGLTHLGSFDPVKFAQHAMARDNSRYLTETGGPEMNKLFKWAKHAEMNKENAGSDLGGMGVHADSLAPKKTLLNTFLMPFNTQMPYTDLALKMYLNGWPAKTGLLNMSGKNFGNPALYTRAWSENKEPWPKLYNKAVTVKDNVVKTAEDIQNEIVQALRKKKH